MQWLFVGLVGIVERIVTWLATKGIKTAGFFLSYMSIIVAGFLGFVALCYTLISALQPITPFGVAFGLAMLPSSTPLYVSAYITALIARRVYDFHKMFTRDFTQSTLKF
jgi:hypothetical protein